MKQDTLRIDPARLKAVMADIRKKRAERDRLEAKASSIDRKISAMGRRFGKQLSRVAIGDVVAVRDDLGRLSYYLVSDVYLRASGVKGQTPLLFLIGRRCTRAGVLRARLAHRFNTPSVEVLMPPVSRAKDRAAKTYIKPIK